MKKYYFAHPVSSYNTSLEKAVETLIRLSVPGYEIESPNQPHHQVNYEKWQRETAENRDVHNAMQYFFKVVQPMCVGCIAMPFLDSKMGLGVAGEINRDAKEGKPTWFVEPVAVLTKADLERFVEDPANGLFVVRPFTDDELMLIRSEVDRHQDNIPTKGHFPGKFVLSHQETRLRTSYVYKGEMRPYAEAHLVSMPIPEGFYPNE